MSLYVPAFSARDIRHCAHGRISDRNNAQPGDIDLVRQTGVSQGGWTAYWGTYPFSSHPDGVQWIKIRPCRRLFSHPIMLGLPPHQTSPAFKTEWQAVVA